MRDAKTLLAVPHDVQISVKQEPRSEIAERALARVEPCQVRAFHEAMRTRVSRAHAVRDEAKRKLRRSG